MQVILYSNDCPRCGILKKKLDAAGLGYEIESDVDKMLELGFTEAPVLEVNGERMLYPEAVRWIKNYREGTI